MNLWLGAGSPDLVRWPRPELLMGGRKSSRSGAAVWRLALLWSILELTALPSLPRRAVGQVRWGAPQGSQPRAGRAGRGRRKRLLHATGPFRIVQAGRGSRRGLRVPGPGVRVHPAAVAGGPDAHRQPAGRATERPDALAGDDFPGAGGPAQLPQPAELAPDGRPVADHALRDRPGLDVAGHRRLGRLVPAPGPGGPPGGAVVHLRPAGAHGVGGRGPAQGTQ